MKTYVAITEAEMSEVLEGKMGFHTVNLRGVCELVFERNITTISGKSFPYRVRIYTSVVNGVTRDCGKDAIRVVLFDNNTDRPVRTHGEKNKIGKYIKRTAGALDRLYSLVRKYFYNVIHNSCVQCGFVLVLRRNSSSGKNFLGCSNRGCSATYPDTNFQI